MIEKYLVNGNEMLLLGFGLDDDQYIKNTLLSNAKMMSVVFQHMIPRIIPHLISEETKGHDFVSQGRLYEMKNATNGNGTYAANLRESRHVGSAGKKRNRFNPQKDCDYYLTQKWNSDNFYYIITDIRNPPIIPIYIASIKELLANDLINTKCSGSFGQIRHRNMIQIDRMSKELEAARQF
jgi:hypothetical protein